MRQLGRAIAYDTLESKRGRRAPRNFASEIETRLLEDRHHVPVDYFSCAFCQHSSYILYQFIEIHISPNFQLLYPSPSPRGFIQGLTTSHLPSPTFVQIHVLAYIFTLSVQTPTPFLAATLFAANPLLSKFCTYHGLKPALLSSTLPPVFSERCTARTCASASGPLGENQSMLSMRTAMVRESGCMRAKTSLSSSVWMRRLSRAGAGAAERRMWAFGVR